MLVACTLLLLRHIACNVRHNAAQASGPCALPTAIASVQTVRNPDGSAGLTDVVTHVLHPHDNHSVTYLPLKS